jgi:hypothetical protein
VACRSPSRTALERRFCRLLRVLICLRTSVAMRCYCSCARCSGWTALLRLDCSAPVGLLRFWCARWAAPIRLLRFCSAGWMERRGNVAEAAAVPVRLLWHWAVPIGLVRFCSTGCMELCGSAAEAAASPGSAAPAPWWLRGRLHCVDYIVDARSRDLL